MNTYRPHPATIERQRFAQHALSAFTRWFTPSDETLDGADERRTDAGRVRELAYRYRETDPGFAADLYAAAARHEGLPAD